MGLTETILNVLLFKADQSEYLPLVIYCEYTATTTVG